MQMHALSGSWEESGETGYNAPPDIKMIQSVERFELNHFLVSTLLFQVAACKYLADNLNKSKCIKNTFWFPLQFLFNIKLQEGREGLSS